MLPGNSLTMPLWRGMPNLEGNGEWKIAIGSMFMSAKVQNNS
jgi:hypothetical protein